MAALDRAVVPSFGMARIKLAPDKDLVPDRSGRVLIG